MTHEQTINDLPPAPSKTLLTYRHVWTERDRDGDMQYEYYCTWSDGSEGMCPSLPWGRLEGAIELPMDRRDAPVNLLTAVQAQRKLTATQATITDFICADVYTSSSLDSVREGSDYQMEVAAE